MTIDWNSIWSEACDRYMEYHGPGFDHERMRHYVYEIVEERGLLASQRFDSNYEKIFYPDTRADFLKVFQKARIAWCGGFLLDPNNIKYNQS